MALFSTSTATTERIPLFVRQAADADVSPVFAEENDFVGQLKKLAKAELQIDAPPTAIILRKVEAGGALGEPLKSKDTVGKAGLKSEDELVVEVSAAASGKSHLSWS